MLSKELTKISHICLIAGDGQLPILVANELVKQKKQLSILCFDKKNTLYFQSHKYLVQQISLENITAILKLIKQTKTSHVICCGGLYFPGVKNIRLMQLPLIRFFKYIIKIIFSKQKGDNFLLNLAEQMLADAGCQVLSVQDVLPQLLCSKQDSINLNLSRKYNKDITLGANILNHNSKFDIGQAIVIKNGRIIGIEGIEGTKELINRCGRYCNKVKHSMEKPVLIKMSKLHQNMKLDVPTIGEDTIKDLVANNFAGLAIKKNSVFMLHKERIKQLAQQHNIFIKIIE